MSERAWIECPVCHIRSHNPNKFPNALGNEDEPFVFYNTEWIQIETGIFALFRIEFCMNCGSKFNIGIRHANQKENTNFVTIMKANQRVIKKNG